MSMFSTKYPNNSRTVTGTPQLYNDDVVLLCDTTLGPVTINLLEIPTKRTPAVGFWNTLWKLYIVDSAGNANTNNITINAYAGSTINGTATFTMNVDNECAVVRIVGDTQYLCSSSNAGGGGVGYQTIENQGVPLPQRTILNFKGKGVLSTDNAPDTDVQIDGVVIVDILNADIITLMNTSTLNPGWQYRITDTNQAEDVIVTATSTSKISLEGRGTFFNADYQSVGNYTGVSPTFVAAKGVWNSTLVLVAGDVVIWNNNHYVNTTGTNTAVDPATDTTNFTVLTRQINNGYIQVVDFVIYDVTSNLPLRRQDKLGNIVEYQTPKSVITYDNFPFGKDTCTNNICIGLGTSFEGLMNVNALKLSNNIIYGSMKLSPNMNLNLVNNNIWTQGVLTIEAVFGSVSSYTVENNEVFGNLTSIVQGGLSQVQFSGNQIQQGCGFQVTKTAGNFDLEANFNKATNAGSMTITNLDTTTSMKQINFNSVSKCTVAITSVSGNALVQRNVLDKSFNITIPALTDNETQGFFETLITNTESNLPEKIDMSDPATFAGTTLTLPNSSTAVGIWLIINPGGNTIQKILNGSSLQDKQKFVSYTNGQFFRLTTTVITGAVANDIINNASTISATNYDGYNPERGESFTAVRGANGLTSPWYILEKEQWT